MKPLRNLPTVAPKPPTEAGSSWPAIAIGAFVAFGGVLFGYDTGTISGILAMDYWRNEFSTGYRDSKGHLDVTPSQSSAIVSILSAGTFFGALCSPLLGDHIGRRWGLIASCWVFNLGVALQTAATSLPLFLAGRFFAGFGVGLISALSKSSGAMFCGCEGEIANALLPSSPLPVRNRTQVDSRGHRRSLPVRNHDRPPSCCHLG